MLLVHLGLKETLRRMPERTGQCSAKIKLFLEKENEKPAERLHQT
jgi:hypothetical protein